MPTELEVLKEKIDEQIKKQKDYQLAFTVLDSQLLQGSNLLTQTQNAIEELEKKRKFLSATVSSEKSELIRSIENRESAVSEREKSLGISESSLRKEKNDLSIEIESFHKSQNDCESLKEELKNKIEKIDGFLNHAKEMVETLK